MERAGLSLASLFFCFLTGRAGSGGAGVRYLLYPAA